MKRSLIIGASLLAVAFAAFHIYVSYNKPYTVDGPSMLPTYHSGQVIKTKPVSPEKLQRGDVVIFRRKNLAGADLTLFKRVVGLPGDTVTVSKGLLVVTKPDGTTYKPYGDMNALGDDKITLEPQTVFVVGDNLENSLDSRIFGPIPFESLIRVVK